MQMKTMVMLCSRATVVVAALFAWTASRADGLIVASGEMVRVSTNSVWSALTVNGELIIDAGVAVRVSDGNGVGVIAIGDGNGATGRVTIASGGALRTNNSSGGKLYLGLNGGRGEMTVDGGVVYAYDIIFANNANESSPASASLRLVSGADVYAQNGLVLAEVTSGASPYAAIDNEIVATEIEVGSNSLLRSWSSTMRNNVCNKIHFRGGRTQVMAFRNLGGGDLVLDGTADCPIWTTFPECSSNFGYLFFADGSGRILMEGSCDFVKDGTSDSRQDLVPSEAVSRLLLGYTGMTRIEKGELMLRGNDILPAGGAVAVAAGCALNLAGNKQTVGDVSGAGFIVSSNAVGRLVLDVAAGVTNTLSLGVASNVAIEKTGAGTLVGYLEQVADVDVKEGDVFFLNPPWHGYTQYRFKVDVAYGAQYDGMHVSELNFYDGDDDVTKPYAAASNELLFDGSRTGSSKWWFTCNYSTQTNFDNAFVDVTYATPLRLTAYTWSTAGDTYPSEAKCRDPGAWRILGRVAGGEWHELSSVGYREYSLWDRSTETKKFEVTYPTSATLSASNVTVADGATLTLEDGLTLTCSSLDGFGTVIRGESAALEVRKADSGTTTVIGPLSDLTALTVADGTYVVRAGIYTPWRHWRFVMKPGGNNAVDFSELALYDRAGRRVNLAADVESWTTVVAGRRVDNLLDNDISTVFWQQNSGNADFTITLKEGVADSIASYILVPQNNSGSVYMSPYEWNVYASPSGEDDSWVLVDAKTSATCRRGSTADWSCYNGGVPFAFTTRRDVNEAGFASAVKVFVSSGATLDLTESATMLANLEVDCSSAGTIRGGTLASSGTLTLVNVPMPLADSYVIPLTFDGTSLPSNMDGWTFTVNGGQLGKRRSLDVSGGSLRLNAKGFVVSFR